jgi:hypothetical protein
MDRLVGRFSGNGSTTTRELCLPRARYTVFVSCDPSEAVRRFSLIDQHGREWPNWRELPVPGDVMAPLVQELLPDGTYRVVVETRTRTCGWDVQVVLNSMQSKGSAPPDWTSPFATPDTVTVRSSAYEHVVIGQTGHYYVDWWIGDEAVGQRGSHRHGYDMRLRAADGRDVVLGHANDAGDHRIRLVFLSAGTWTVEMNADAPWGLTVSPVIGAMGGGARGF